MAVSAFRRPQGNSSDTAGFRVGRSPSRCLASRAADSRSIPYEKDVFGMRKNMIVTSVLTAGLALCGAGTAYAHHVGGNLNHSTTGASFSGTWDWSHEDQGNGGFNFYGTISDTNCGDGDNV